MLAGQGIQGTAVGKVMSQETGLLGHPFPWGEEGHPFPWWEEGHLAGWSALAALACFGLAYYSVLQVEMADVKTVVAAALEIHLMVVVPGTVPLLKEATGRMEETADCLLEADYQVH